MTALMRPARREDVPAIVALLHEDALGRTREAAPHDPLYLRAFETIVDDHNNQIYVLEKAGAVVGCAQLTIIPGLSRKGSTRAIIEAVRVAESERGAGLGARLIDSLIQVAATRGCSLVQLTSDKTRIDAHRFYERLGFTRSHDGFKLALPKEKP